MSENKKTLTVQGNDISLITQADQDYISITDMAKGFEGEAGEYIRNWMRNASTIQFLGVWEKVHNPNFNLVEFHQIKAELVDNTFIMSAKKWVERTNAIGIKATAGRYGGTYAHNEIAIQFATWLNPEFHVYLVKEFKRLKTVEAQEQKESLEWHVRRTLARVNYRIHADAVQQHLIPPRLSTKLKGIVYASEADLLNVALFGMTAKEWKAQNPDKKGNIRDYATGDQLLVLSNLENLNAEYISMKMEQSKRLERLNEIAIYQMEILTVPDFIKKLPTG